MKKTKTLLITLDVIWSLAALIYDWPIIITLPWYSWPFIVICPLYPLLLALSWWLMSPYLVAVTALASIVWGLLALAFYPLTMLADGWSWNAIGQIVWVWVYAAQGWWMMVNLPLPKRAVWLASGWMLLVLTIEYQTKTYGYLDVAALSSRAWFGVYLAGLVSVFVLVGLNQERLSRVKVSH